MQKIPNSTMTNRNKIWKSIKRTKHGTQRYTTNKLIGGIMEVLPWNSQWQLSLRANSLLIRIQIRPNTYWYSDFIHMRHVGQNQYIFIIGKQCKWMKFNCMPLVLDTYLIQHCCSCQLSLGSCVHRMPLK